MKANFLQVADEHGNFPNIPYDGITTTATGWVNGEGVKEHIIIGENDCLVVELTENEQLRNRKCPVSVYNVLKKLAQCGTI